MRHCVMLMIVALLLATSVSPLQAGEGDAAAASKENLELKRQMRELRAQMQQMQKRMQALEAQVNAGAAAAAKPAPQPAVAAAAPAPPPGIVAAGVPLPAPAPPGVTVGAALKGLLPGPVSGPTSRRIGTEARAAPPPEGVIMPSLQGVPKVFIPDIGAVGDFTVRQSDLHPGDPRYDPSNDQFRVRDSADHPVLAHRSVHRRADLDRQARSRLFRCRGGVPRLQQAPVGLVVARRPVSAELRPDQRDRHLPAADDRPPASAGAIHRR